jgi:molybdopterin converting factor subunit 1
MNCTVLLFAGVRDAVGRDRLTLTLPTGATVSDALDVLAANHSSIHAMRQSLAVAVDERYATMSTVLDDGCAIALIPPVSGG